MDQVKKAFRQEALKWHPDSPTGDATRFRDTQEAYDFLKRGGLDDAEPIYTNMRTRRPGEPFKRTPESDPVNDFARAESNAGRPQSGGRRAETWEEKERRAESAKNVGRRPNLLQLYWPVIFVLLNGFAFYYFFSNDTFEPRNPLEAERRAGVAQMKNAKLGKGQDYTMIGELAARKQSDVLFIGSEFPKVVTEDGSSFRGTQFGETLRFLLDEKDANGQPRYKSIAATCSERDINDVADWLRISMPKERFAFTVYSFGRQVAEYTKDFPRQEIILFETFDYRTPPRREVPDRGAINALATVYDFDLFVFDVPESLYRRDFEDSSDPSSRQNLNVKQTSDFQIYRQEPPPEPMADRS